MEYIVLGQIPGTNLEIGFVGYMLLFDLVLTYYIFKKYHPEKLTWLNQKLHLSKNLEKLHKKLIHYRDNVLGPKLKFLK